jgi:hypothetical protein
LPTESLTAPFAPIWCIRAFAGTKVLCIMVAPLPVLRLNAGPESQAAENKTVTPVTKACDARTRGLLPATHPMQALGAAKPMCDLGHVERLSLSLHLPPDCGTIAVGDIPMGATMEAVQPIQYPEIATHAGVVCIFCGLPTPVRTRRDGISATHLPCPRVAIVRCEVCGKEAPYVAHEILEFGKILLPRSASLWFAKDAI